jgi:ankyrin repeat protein
VADLSSRERARAEQLARAQDCAKEQISEDMKTNTRKEVDFLFTLLTECFSLSYTKSAAVRALVAAASYGYSSTVQNLVKMGIDPSASSGHRKETALHFAASAGDEALLVFLLDHQANIESRDNHRHTPLHCAAWAGHEGSVRILLARGADPNAQDDKGRTALFGAAGGGYLAVVKVLLANRAEYGIRGGVKNQTALERAESKGFADIAKVLRSQSTSSQGPSDQ